jgi:hypothetical protein
LFLTLTKYALLEGFFDEYINLHSELFDGRAQRAMLKAMLKRGA